MNDDDLRLTKVPSDDGDSGERLQESVVGDAAGVAAATFAGLKFLRQEITVRRDRAQMAAEMAELRRALELERRLRILHSHGLAGLDAYDSGYVDLGDFDPEPFTGFDVDEY